MLYHHICSGLHRQFQPVAGQMLSAQSRMSESIEEKITHLDMELQKRQLNLQIKQTDIDFNEANNSIQYYVNKISGISSKPLQLCFFLTDLPLYVSSPFNPIVTQSFGTSIGLFPLK